MSRPQIYQTRITDVTDDEKDALGTHRYEVISGVGAWYKRVKYNTGTGTVAAVANQTVVYHGDDGYDDNEVTMDYTDGIIAAGQLVSAPTNGQYCWILIKGPQTHNLDPEASNDATPVAAADGDPVVIGDADGTVRRENTVVDADAERERVIGQIIDDSAKKVLFDFLW